MKKYLFMALIAALVVVGVAGTWAGPVEAGTVTTEITVGVGGPKTPVFTVTEGGVAPGLAGLGHVVGFYQKDPNAAPGVYCFPIPPSMAGHGHQIVVKFQAADGNWYSMSTTGGGLYTRCAYIPTGINSFYLGY